MSGQIKTIARVLQSAGSAIQENGNIVLLSVENNHIVEKIYDGEDLKDQRKVIDGVKPGASAVYVISDNHAFIIIINEHGILKASEFDTDSEEWDESDLGLGAVKAQADSGLAAVTIADSILVFYQAADGTIASIRHNQGSKDWSAGFNVPGTKAEPGTPISVFANDKAMVVAFVEKDGKVHAHSRDFESGSWTDTALENSAFDEKMVNMTVSQDVETNQLEAYVLTGSTLHHVKKDGTQSVVGSYSGGVFTAATRAEAGDIYGNNYGTMNNYFGSNNYGYGGGYGGYGRCPPPYFPPRCCW